MQIGLGVLRFSPKHFWQMTIQEFWQAHKGYLITIPKLPEKVSVGKLWIEPPSAAEIAELKRVHGLN